MNEHIRNLLIISFLLLLSVLFISDANAEPRFKVAVVDTGYVNGYPMIPICKGGFLDFTNSGSIEDIDKYQRHGTNIASLITREAGQSSDYCLIMVKVYKSRGGRLYVDNDAYIKALRFLNFLAPTVITLAMSGEGMLDNEEAVLLKRMLDNNITVVAAAGNLRKRLSWGHCKYFPACADPRIIVVGNSTGPTSNYGPVVDFSLDGEDQAGGGVILSGSSQAAAIYTGRLINRAIQRSK